MSHTVIITDSSACLPGELVREYGIVVVPHRLHLGGQTYEDGALSPGDFYALLEQARGHATTTSPPPGAFLEAFRGAAARGAAALCITFSARFSSTYDSALSGARLFQEERPDFPLEVLDSRNLAMAHGLAVLAAARAAAAGAGLEECRETARAVSERAQLLGVLSTLRYLARGGRVPRVAHWAASLLQVKPIIEAVGEEVRPVERVRTFRRALDRLVSLTQERVRDGGPLHLAVMHAAAPEVARELAERLETLLHPRELLVTEFTPVMGVHVGPGFVGVAFYTEPVAGGGPAPSRELAEDIARVEAALGPLPPPSSPPALVVLAGLPGSGKSTLARRLRERVPLAVLESDRLRKLLFPTPVYSAEESRWLFRVLHAVLERLLAQGVSALLDATNLREAHRRPLCEMARRYGARLVVVWVETPPHLARLRLEARRQGRGGEDWSDAGPEVYERMRQGVERPHGPHLVVDTSQDMGPALEEVVRAIRGEAIPPGPSV